MRMRAPKQQMELMEPVIPADTDQEIRAENTSPSPLFPPLRKVPPEKRDDVAIRTHKLLGDLRIDNLKNLNEGFVYVKPIIIPTTTFEQDNYKENVLPKRKVSSDRTPIGPPRKQARNEAANNNLSKLDQSRNKMLIPDLLFLDKKTRF